MPELKPSSLYTVRILSSEEFDKLPFKHAKTSLGAADPSTNIAYVRDTGFNDITKDTIAHELDELMANVSPHEEDGIRYKNLGNVFSSFGNAIGSVAKPVVKGIGAVAKAPFQLAGSAIKGLTSPGGVFGRFGGGGAQPTSIPTPPGFPGTATFPGVGQGPLPSPTLGGGTTSAGSNIFDRFVSGAAKLFAPKPDVNVPQDGSSEKGAFDLFRNLAVPLATTAVGNLFAPKVDTPDFSSISESLRSAATGKTPSEFRQLGGDSLREIIGRDITAPPDTAFSQGDIFNEEQLQDDLKALEQAFKAANPNANVANNSAFLEERNRLIERARERRTAARDALGFEFERQQRYEKLEATRIALDLDQAQMNQLMQLAQLDVSEIMLRTGITFGEAQQVKKLFGDLGQQSYKA